MLIGICGSKKSGKDEIAKRLEQEHNFVRYSFADPLKKACMEIFGFSKEQMWGSGIDKETVDLRWEFIRLALQLVGTNLFRNTLPNIDDGFRIVTADQIWVNRFKFWYKENKDKNIVIPDVRFINEIFAVKKMGGMICLVNRKGNNLKDGHISECEWKRYDNWKHIFSNDGTLDDLYKGVDVFMNEVL